MTAPSMTTRRVVFFNHTAKVSGAEYVLRMLLEQLPRAQFEPVLVCPEGDMAGIGAQLGVPHVVIPALKARFTHNPLRLLRYVGSAAATIVALRRVLGEQQPALVHANSVRAGMVATLASLGTEVPILWHIHDVLPEHPISSLVRAVARLRKRNVFVAVSHATARGFVGSDTRLEVQVIHNGVDTEKFRPDAGERAAMRAELGLEDGAFAVATVGQITPRKGQLGIVKLFAEVVREVPGAQLLIVGTPMFHKADQVYLQSIKRKIQALGLQNHVRLLGARRDVPALLNATDALALNSSHEPFCLVVTEALATGKPVVAPAIDGFPEIIVEGENGFLTSPGRPEQMAARLVELARDPALRERAGQHGRELTLGQFSQETYVKRFTAFYNAVIRTPEMAGERVVFEQ